MNKIIKRKEKSQRKKKRKAYKWVRKPRSSNGKPPYNFSWIQSRLPFADKLSWAEKSLILLFWPKRTFSLSYREIAEDLELPNRKASVHFMQMLEEMGIIAVTKTLYRKKLCARNFYKLTYKGQKILKAVLKKATNGKDLPPEILPIGKKKYSFKIKPKSGTDSSQKKPVEHKILFFNKNNICQGELPSAGDFSFENRKNLETEKLKRTVFSVYGLEHHLDSIHIHPKRLSKLIQSLPVSKISRVLAHIRKKLDKGWRLRNFWAYFTYQIRQDNTQSFHQRQAQAYRNAIDGNENDPMTKRLMEGIDTRKFIDAVKSLEKLTSEKLTISALERIMQRKNSRSHLWSAAAEAVLFRMGLLGKLSEGRAVETRPIYEIREKKRVLITTGGKRVESTYRERVKIGEEALPDKNAPIKTKIKSWVGFFMHVLKAGSVEAIKEDFYKKKKERPNRAAFKGTPLDMNDFDFSEEEACPA
jgi:hypothetical protein